MNDPDTRPPDDPLAALMAAANKDVPPPDAAFLAALREQSTAAFENPTPTPAQPASPRKRTMIPLAVRWIAAAVAALVFIGVGVAVWVSLTRVPAPEPQQPDEKFKFEPGLADDGRIGKVTDVQGVVAVKPVTGERWSPVSARLVLKPGDWVRTDARGANAAALRLLKSNIVVGPHSTLELVKADEYRLSAGEIEIDAPDAVELHGPDKQKVSVKGKQVFRVEKEKLVRVEQDPKWLQGFKGASANESLGSLVATVDGRDVPLTVGYHHVTVDIRDQIARTTVEESFVNTTPNVLEGVFHFPLPQDASISGFGMWIGNELVEADVVEKQRAREIYEDILRSNRDPALLEWAGGNIFKARVFPIPGRSEKRIKITYTQVLPLQGNRYRYSYGLQSELLKQRPLRDLTINVKVSSASLLKSVSSPTHPARVASTDHSGQVEFSAQEYTPTRDFEAVVEVDAGRPDVVVVPHRRGDDGYFMVQLTPPGAAGDWERPLVPSGEALRLVLLADTSASIDKTQRANQNAILAALLGSLTEKDTITVGACDVNCDWAFEKAVPATPANVATALNFVEKRTSLGWTDLDKAFASALAQSAPGTHVIYLGDGASTTGKADPVEFAKRLQQLYAGKTGTVHAVALGSTYEPAALKAIAALGGGSVRKVSGDRGPQATALDLLTEIAAPALRDVKVTFNGLRTARVYPEVLPNVPAGTQQILLGRYLPEGKDQSGEIVVTGTLNGKPVRYTSKVSLKDAEQGNSFVPRLWARMHLDALLEQGPSARADVIALSEEFHIITPYTSFLVLESDADRARYAVQRRFGMRDGERFFQDGRDNAAFDLKQKQMRLAGDYRTALRRQVLAELNRLGRDPRLFRRPEPRAFASYNFATLREFDADGTYLALGDGASVEFAYGVVDSTAALDDFRRYDVGLDVDMPAKAMKDAEWFDGGEVDLKAKGVWERFEPLSEDWAGRGVHEPAFAERLTTAPFDGYAFGAEPLYRESIGDELGLPRLKAAGQFYRRGYRGPQLQWLGTLFPALPPARAPKPKPSTWPDAAVTLSKSLLRTDKVVALKGGLVVTRQTDGFTGDALSSRQTRLELVSASAWLGRTTPVGGPVSVEWCDAKERGAYSAAFLLGRVRASNALDLRQLPLELGDNSVTPLHETYANMTAAVEVLAKDRSLLTLKYPGNADYELRVLVDTARSVVLSYESRNKGKVTSGTKFSDFVEVGGVWWAQKVEALDADGKRHGLTTQTVTEVAADAFAKRLAQELADKDKVLFLRSPLPPLTEAKARVAAGKATFDDRATLVLYFGVSQQWTRAAEHLAECEKLAAGKGGVRWLRDTFLLAARKHDDLRKRLQEEGAALTATADPGTRANEYFLAEHLTQQGQQILTPTEQLALLDAIKKVYERQAAHLDAVKAWRVRQVHAIERSGDLDKARGLWKALATDFPRDAQLQQSYARSLAQSGDYPAAYAWLKQALANKWEQGQEDSLRDLYTDFLQQQGRYREQAEFLAEWLTRGPRWDNPYARYLAALIRSNQAKRAEEIASEWLKAGLVEGELPRPVAARVSAAVAFMLGSGYNLYANRGDEKWLPLLAEAALHFARRDAQLDLAASILNTSRFTGTDPGRATRKALLDLLVKEIDTLPLARVDYLVNWTWDGERAADWKTIAASLRKRWDAEKDAHVKHRVGQILSRVLPWIGGAEKLSFLRVQYKDGPAAYRAAYASDLFDALLGQPWTAETEDEALTLLPKLGDSEEPARALFARLAALHRLTDVMLEARFQAAAKRIEHPEKLPRPELQKKHDEIRKQTREGYADRLRKEIAKLDKPLAAWFVAECVWLDAQLERDPKAVAADCWTFLPPVPKERLEDASVAALDELLRARFLTTLTNLAARKSADNALVERLLAYFDEQAKAHPDDPRWRGETYRLLVALDRVKELEAELRRWVAADGDNRWRVALGYLLAEQGKVADAIALFEAVEKADELSPDAHRALTAWYLVEGRRAEHDKARVAVHKATDEYQLQRRLNGMLQPWQYGSGHLPSQLDAEVLDLFAVLFEKSATPQNYLDSLKQFYVASRDFRLLAALADGVVGHTAGKAYPFVQGMLPVLAEVRDEATVDELAKRIEEVRKTAKAPVDLRALDMLELMVERRAAELQNQPGPHADKALAALERAFKREWNAGELRLMADFLAALGNVPQPAIAKEQLRQLETLHREAAKGSYDRLRIAHRHAETLWGYSRRSDATDQLLAALKEFEEANKGVLPTSANDTLGIAVSYFESEGHYDRGEKLLLEQLKHPVHAEQRDWLARLLSGVYLHALQNKGSVSLGAGETLYKAMERKLIADLPAADQTQRYRLFDRLSDVYRAAHRLKLPTVAADLKQFTADTLPPLLREQTVNYEYLVREYGDTVAEVRGPRDAIAFLLDRFDDEPDWLRYTNQDGWNLYANRIGEWRETVKQLGDLEPRLLAFVLAELRRDLRTQSSRGRYLYDARHSRYWPEKADDFAKVADEVLAERAKSTAIIEYVAEYLFFGLKREKRAIEALSAAHVAKVLSVSGRSQLADYLHRTGRYAESIPLLQKLVEEHADTIGYRTRLMHAYFRTERQKELLALLKETDERWHKDDRWTDHALAVLAESTLENRLFVQSVAYYEELIPRYQRAHPRSNDGVLSNYYGRAARAYAGLGNTKKAVDMASGAVVSWGANTEQRKRALDSLVAVLVESPDLGKFVAELDKEKLQSAIVRKAIGQAYVKKTDHARAIPQLQMASELQPNDADTYTLLVECFDKLGDAEKGAEVLLRAVELSRRDLGLYERLGQRYSDLKRQAEAERAFTSMVEMQPQESESHAALAAVREKQKRWDEAIAHWARVAELRALEPTGLVEMAEAQIAAERFEDAAKTLRKVRTQTWPPRFNNTDLEKARELERKLEARPKR